jgi:guanylate kinase
MIAFPVVISGPSGAGKTSLRDKLLAANPDLDYSVSTTTRPIRTGETDGKDYFFVSDDEFDRIIHEDGFAEWAEVHNCRYGTRKQVLDKSLENDRITILDLDVQGGRSLKASYPLSVLVFVVPPTMEELERRLRMRSTDSDEVISVRLRNALDELKAVEDYDYVVVNDALDDAVSGVETIIDAESKRRDRVMSLAPPEIFQSAER